MCKKEEKHYSKHKKHHNFSDFQVAKTQTPELGQTKGLYSVCDVSTSRNKHWQMLKGQVRTYEEKYSKSIVVGFSWKRSSSFPPACS